jgi:hypothetical protein
VLDYYGMLSAAPAPDASAPRVTVVRPERGTNLADFEAGHMVAATRTQFLHADLIENIVSTGRYRLLPIRDHEALARSLPGTKPGFIPAGLYGPSRRIPPEPVPTILVTLILAARADLPGRVARDILEIVYDPRFGRDLQYEISETTGRIVGGLPLHPAAEIYYHRNDQLTSDRLGRLSFVASAVAALAASLQFIARARRQERIRVRRRLLGSELAKLQAIRHRIEAEPSGDTVEALMREADDLLCDAEQDAAAGLLDAEGIQSLRSVHQVCWNAAAQTRSRRPGAAPMG